MFKSKPLKGRYVSSDARNYWIHKLLSMSARGIMHHLYPRMMAIHDLNETIALPLPLTNPQSEEGTNKAVKIRIDMPSLMRDSHIFMAGHGVYIIGEFLGLRNTQMTLLIIHTQTTKRLPCSG